MATTERQLFGTDGIRGKAGVYPLIPEEIVKLGQAAAEIFLAERDPADRSWPVVVIGKDTRQSGDMLESAIAAGLNSRGIDVRLAGVIPTPAVAYLTQELGAAFGIVISASHNPFGDNGIKFFGPDGYKLPDEMELAIEQKLLSSESAPIENIGRTSLLEDAVDRYVHFVVHGAVDDENLLRGMKVALDAANGAASVTSVEILKKLGAEVLPFHCQPSGQNINRDCGCTHAEIIEALVRETGADVGVSHDGDADRLLLCDETGSALDGDELMAIAAIDQLERGELAGDTLVATVMSNAGLEVAVTAAGGKVARTGVGDRYVIEEMRRGGYNLGGEQSGHLIFRDQNTTGDGIVAAVQLLTVMKRKGQPLSELRKLLEKFPQAQRNLRVTSRIPVDQLDAAGLISDVEKELGSEGRVLIRYSGTEPLIRLLIEGRDKDWIESKADEIVAAIATQIGE